MKDKSLFREFIGDSPLFLIIDFFLENREGDYTKQDIIGYTGISRGTLFKYWKKLEKFNIVKVNRRFGKTKLFKLNTKNSIVKKMIELELDLIKKAFNKEYQTKDIKINNKNTSKTPIVV